MWIIRNTLKLENSMFVKTKTNHTYKFQPGDTKF